MSSAQKFLGWMHTKAQMPFFESQEYCKNEHNDKLSSYLIKIAFNIQACHENFITSLYPRLSFVAIMIISYLMINKGINK
jgi:hypothetical protein